MMERSYRTIQDNIKAIRASIEDAAVKAGRDPASVRLMAVTKTQPADAVNAAIAQGILLLGENRAQELLEKYDDYDKDGVEIHFIGSLQTNKVRQIADKVTMIHSVDSLRLAQEISRRCAAAGKTMELLIEVNVAGEQSKSGVSPREAEAIAREISLLPGILVRGLMTIPPICDKEAEIEGYFFQMSKLLVDIKEKNIDNVPMDTLSMGMSGDYPAAIKHGATIIRLGGAIFGQRIYR